MKGKHTGLKKATAFALMLGLTMQFTACGGAEKVEESNEVVEVTVTPTPIEEVTNTPTPETTETADSSMGENEVDLTDDPYTQQLIQAEEEANKADETLNTSEGVEIVEELDIYLYVQKSCNARTGDGTNFDKVTQLEVGAKPHITGRTANDWYRIAWGDGVVYASSQFFGEADPLASSKVDTSESDNGGSGSSSDVDEAMKSAMEEAFGDDPVPSGQEMGGVGRYDDPSNKGKGFIYTGDGNW